MLQCLGFRWLGSVARHKQSRWVDQSTEYTWQHKICVIKTAHWAYIFRRPPASYPTSSYKCWNNYFLCCKEMKKNTTSSEGTRKTVVFGISSSTHREKSYYDYLLNTMRMRVRQQLNGTREQWLPIAEKATWSHLMVVVLKTMTLLHRYRKEWRKEKLGCCNQEHYCNWFVAR